MKIWDLVANKMLIIVVTEPGLGLRHIKCTIFFHFRCMRFLHNELGYKVPQPGWRSGLSCFQFTGLRQLRFPDFYHLIIGYAAWEKSLLFLFEIVLCSEELKVSWAGRGGLMSVRAQWAVKTCIRRSTILKLCFKGQLQMSRHLMVNCFHPNWKHLVDWKISVLGCNSFQKCYFFFFFDQLMWFFFCSENSFNKPVHILTSV